MKQENQSAVVVVRAPTPGRQSSTLKLMDAAMKAQSIPSYYRLARVLGVSDNTMTRWKQDRVAPNDAMAARLAEMAGMDPGVVVAELNADRATDPDVRLFWRGIAERLRHAGLAALFGMVIAYGGPIPEARAFEVATHVDQAGLCVMSTAASAAEAVERTI